MIVVKLMGGLGNQMFQYALGKHLADKHHTDLKLDLAFLLERTPRENFTFRDYELDIFNIESHTATSGDLENFFGNPSGFKKIIKKVENTFARYHYVKERTFNFDPDTLKSENNSYLDGYWQSEKYFKEIEERIRKEFSFKTNLSPEFQELSKQMLNTNSVAVHVRKTDFVKSNYHFNLDDTYYKKAESEIKNKIRDAHLFVFSDDMEWCKQNLSFELPVTYTTQLSGKDKTKDSFQLMTQCKNFIIANSSFSWWAAWLSSNKDKIVIAPQKWFVDPAINTQDLIPSSWTKL